MRDAYDYDEYGGGGSFLGTILLMLIGGALALAAFDAFGQLYSPEAGYAELTPVPLATQSLVALFGEEFGQYGQYAHYAMGIVGYPLGYVLLARPLSRLIAPNLHWWVTGIVFGVVIWAFALFVVEHLIAGNPPFYGFNELTWVALAGHVLYGLALAAVMRDGRYV